MTIIVDNIAEDKVMNVKLPYIVKINEYKSAHIACATLSRKF